MRKSPIPDITVNLVEFLKEPRRIKQIEKEFNIQNRSVYRYLDKIEALGFPLDKGFDGKWFIVMCEVCPFCGSEKHKSREYKKQDVHQSTFTSPAFFN